MKNKSVCGLLVLMMVWSGFAATVTGAEEHLKIEREGPLITVSGVASQIQNGTDVPFSRCAVTLSITNEYGDIICIRQTEANEGGQYLFQFSMFDEESGEWLLKVCETDGSSTNRFVQTYEYIAEPSGTKPMPTAKPSGGGTGGGGGGSSGYKGLSGQDEPTAAPQASAAPVFSDIVGHWAENEIKRLMNLQVLNGVSNTEFQPEREISRAEFTKMIVQSLHLPLQDYDGCFLDVENSAWYADFIQTAVEAEIIVGNDGIFRPDAPISREEMTKILIEAYRNRLGFRMEEIELQFTDADEVSVWAKPYVAEAVRLGLMQGMTANAFCPQSLSTRAQAAAVICRLLDVLKRSV